MSAIPRRNATLLTARVKDPGCASLEEQLPETIQLPYPRPRSSATRLFPKQSLTQLRLFRNNSLGPATTGGKCLKTIHPCPATTKGNCLKTIRPCSARSEAGFRNTSPCPRPRHAGAVAGMRAVPVCAGLPSQGYARCLGTAFQLVAPPSLATQSQCAREGCPAMDTMVPFYRYPALAFSGTIVL